MNQIVPASMGTPIQSTDDFLALLAVKKQKLATKSKLKITRDEKVQDLRITPFGTSPASGTKGGKSRGDQQNRHGEHNSATAGPLFRSSSSNDSVLEADGLRRPCS